MTYPTLRLEPWAMIGLPVAVVALVALCFGLLAKTGRRK